MRRSEPIAFASSQIPKGRRSHRQEVPRIAHLLYGIRRNAAVARRAGTGNLRKISRPVRNSNLDRGSYAEISDLLLEANAGESDSPKGRGSPRKISVGKNTVITDALAGPPYREAATQLWASTALLATDLSSASYIIIKGDPADAEKPVGPMRTSAARFRAVQSDDKYTLRPIKRKTDIGNLASPAKIQKLRAAHHPQFKLNRYVRKSPHNLASAGIM